MFLTSKNPPFRAKSFAIIADSLITRSFKGFGVLGSESISVDNLQIGMYVSQLDRPWLETPFLFQGFYVRNEDDIAEIRRHCKLVFIDQEQSAGSINGVSASFDQSPTTSQKITDVKHKLSFFKRLARRLSTKPEVDHQATGTFYRDSSSLKDELIPATESHNKALVAIKDVFAELRDKKHFDLKSLTTVVDPMIESVLRNQDALACLTRMRRKTDYLYSHSLGSAVWALVLGRHIGLDREALRAVGLGAMLLDVGMTQFPSELLTKREKLTPAENKLMKRHVEVGLEIVEKGHSVDRRVLEMVAHHHERYNGTGYPHGVSGNAIPVYGRIAGLADCYDAMITERPYAASMSSLDAIQQLRHRADVDFQAEMVDQFMQAIGAFPTGTLVELNTGEVGVVVSQNRLRRLRPAVMMVLDANKQTRTDCPMVDLALQTTADDGTQSLWIAKGLEPGAYGIDPVKYYVG